MVVTKGINSKSQIRILVFGSVGDSTGHPIFAENNPEKQKT